MYFNVRSLKNLWKYKEFRALRKLETILHVCIKQYSSPLFYIYDSFKQLLAWTLKKIQNTDCFIFSKKIPFIFSKDN